MQPTWTKWRKFLRGPLGRDATAGALAGAIGGGVSGGAGFASDIDGLLGLELSALGMVLHVLISIGAGALFGSLFRHQPGAYAALISNSLLYALLLWALGPLTLAPLLEGASPTWSAGEAHAAFSSLIVHLLFGGLTGFGFYVAASLFDLYLRPLPSVSPPTRDKARVIILGGGFGGISTARGLEQALWRDTGLEIMLLSQSNYLLFTPMLAEVAASALEPQHISSPLRATLSHTPVPPLRSRGHRHDRTDRDRPRRPLQRHHDSTLRPPRPRPWLYPQLLRASRPGGERLHAEDPGGRNPAAEPRHRAA